MSRKRAIKRMFLTVMWLTVATGMGVIITAAIREQDAGICKGYDVEIKGFGDGMLFTSKEQIIKLLKTATKGEITNQSKTAFNLSMIEDLLEQSAWVYNADLYFDNNNILHANVTERKPLARVFTNNGASFYIDEAGKQIPLSEKVSLDLPVFTGYPSKKIPTSSDSILIQNVIAAASFINGDPFWNAQVAQIDINTCGTDCWNMEMIPVVGNHKVELGDGSDIAGKFHRLYLFYDQVLKRTGFDKYQKIDVAYNGQVIGIKGNYTKVDSIQLRKNIENLLNESRASNEALQVAPSVNTSTLLLADTSAESKLIYNNDNIVDADSAAFEQRETVERLPAIKAEEVVANASKKTVMPVKKEPSVIKRESKTEKKVEAKKVNKPASKSSGNEKSVSKKVKPKTSTKKVEKVATKPKVVAKEEEKRNLLEKAPQKKTAITKTVTNNKKKQQPKKTNKK